MNYPKVEGVAQSVVSKVGVKALKALTTYLWKEMDDRESVLNEK
jgi:hypothetical protein